MRFSFDLNFGRSYKPEYVERDREGNWFYQTWSSLFKANKIKCAKSRYEAVMNNPAVLINFRLISDMGSLCRIHEYKDNNINTTDFLYTLKSRPNFFQSWEQFFKDYYLWVNMGTAYLYDSSNGKLTNSDQLYWLIPDRLQFTSKQTKMLQSLMFANKSYNELMKEMVKYTQPNGDVTNIPLKYIKPFFSLSNGLSGNWYEGGSYLDALYKVISNSDSSIDSLGVNLKYTQKFAVSAKSDKTSLADFPTMGDTEKIDVEEKIASKKEVTVSKAPLNVERFVKDIANLKLDETFLTQYFIIGKMFGIPKDVSEAYLTGGATFENQDKSMIKFISTSLQPLMDNLVATLMDQWGVKDLRATWEHLPIYQTAKKEEAESRKLDLENLKMAVELGLSDADKENYLNEIMQ